MGIYIDRRALVIERLPLCFRTVNEHGHLEAHSWSSGNKTFDAVWLYSRGLTTYTVVCDAPHIPLLALFTRPATLPFPGQKIAL